MTDQFNLPDYLEVCEFVDKCEKCGKEGTLWARISGYEQPEAEFYLCSACAQERLAKEQEESEAMLKASALYPDCWCSASGCPEDSCSCNCHSWK